MLKIDVSSLDYPVFWELKDIQAHGKDLLLVSNIIKFFLWKKLKKMNIIYHKKPKNYDLVNNQINSTFAGK